MKNRIKILKEILKERIKQDIKWGEQNHSPEIWQSILLEEIGEVNTEILSMKFSKKDSKKYRDELIQSTAVSLAIIECLDRNKKEI